MTAGGICNARYCFATYFADLVELQPERIQGAPYAVQSDIWSLGLTIVEVAQNHPALPPPGHPQLAIFELLEFIVHQPIPELPADKYSPELRDFVKLWYV